MDTPDDFGPDQGTYGIKFLPSKIMLVSYMVLFELK